MANEKISQLPAAGTLIGTELAELVQSGINVQTTLNAIEAFILANVPGGYLAAGPYTLPDGGTEVDNYTPATWNNDVTDLFIIPGSGSNDFTGLAPLAGGTKVRLWNGYDTTPTGRLLFIPADGTSLANNSAATWRIRFGNASAGSGFSLYGGCCLTLIYDPAISRWRVIDPVY